MNELLDAQTGWTITTAVMTIAGMCWLLATAYAASLIGSAREGREDGSLAEQHPQIDSTRGASRR